MYSVLGSSSDRFVLQAATRNLSSVEAILPSDKLQSHNFTIEGLKDRYFILNGRL